MSSSDSSFSSSLAFSAAGAASPPAAAPPAAAAGAAPPDGTDASFFEPSAMTSLMSLPSSSEMSFERRSSSTEMLEGRAKGAPLVAVC